jgi:hypothetical protein
MKLSIRLNALLILIIISSFNLSTDNKSTRYHSMQTDTVKEATMWIDEYGKMVRSWGLWAFLQAMSYAS